MSIPTDSALLLVIADGKRAAVDLEQRLGEQTQRADHFEQAYNEGAEKMAKMEEDFQAQIEEAKAKAHARECELLEEIETLKRELADARSEG